MVFVGPVSVPAGPMRRHPSQQINQCDRKKTVTLRFADPTNKMQARILGIKRISLKAYPLNSY